MTIQSESQETRFENFEIWISPGLPDSPTKYPVQAFSMDGTGADVMTLDIEDPEFQTLLNTVLGIGGSKEKRQAFGGMLFGRLFIGDILRRWSGSLGRIRGGQGLGLRILLVVTAPELADIPWEILYDRDSDFLATAGDQVLARYLPVPEPRYLRAPDVLRVLLVVESPESQTCAFPRIEKKHWEPLQKQIAGIGERVQVDVHLNLTLEQIQNELQAKRYHVFHYLGHGASDALILVEPHQTTATEVDAQAFARIFQGLPSLRLVMLTACNSARGEERVLFSGVGPALIRMGVPAVIAMQYEMVTLETAIVFSEKFYQCLTNGMPVDVATNLARQTLISKDPAGRGWSTPILFLGTRSGRILGLPTGLETLAPMLDNSEYLADRLHEWFELKSLLDELRRPLQKFIDNLKRAPRLNPTSPEDLRKSEILKDWEDYFQDAYSKFDTVEWRHITRPPLSTKAKAASTALGILTEVPNAYERLERDITSFRELLWSLDARAWELDSAQTIFSSVDASARNLSSLLQNLSRYLDATYRDELGALAEQIRALRREVLKRAMH